MAKKLKLVLQNLYLERRNQLLLFLKALIFGLALLIASMADFSFILAGFFIVASILLYSRPLFENYSTKYAFIILLAVSIVGMKATAGTLLFLPALVIFPCIFYLLAGIKNFIIVKRSRLYYIAVLAIFYISFLLFFSANKSEFFFLKYMAVFFSALFIYKEWLSLVTSFHFPKREFVASLVSAFILSELLWAVALLPIGLINAANFMLLCSFFLGEFLYRHFTGNLSKAFLLQSSVFFLLIAAIIFLSSSWSITGF